MYTPDARWEDFRRQMPAAEKWAYFDHAAVAPLCAPAHDTFTAWISDICENGDVNWNTWRAQLEKTRGLAAKLLSAQRDEIALIRNTTEGVTLVAEGFPWHEGDNVVVPDAEFPSNLYPWLNLHSRGVEVRKVKTTDERLEPAHVEAACDERTRMIAVSWVGYATGWQNDLAALAEIAHRRSAYLFVDAIQGLGVIPLDVTRTPVDFLAADGHKWLLSPEGAGILYVRRELLDLLRPLGVGWNSVQHAGDFDNLEMELKASASRYEGGSYNTGGLAALGASLQLWQEFGSAAIWERILKVTDLLCDRIEGIGGTITSSRVPAHRSGIIACEIPGRNPADLKRTCRERGVVVNCRKGRLRLSPHAYTNEADVQRLIDAIP